MRGTSCLFIVIGDELSGTSCLGRVVSGPVVRGRIDVVPSRLTTRKLVRDQKKLS